MSEELAQFTAADMTTSAADGFRDGAKEIERVTSEIELMVNSLANGEWAEHAGETELGSRLELEITKLVGLATSLKSERDVAQAEVERMRNALEFYADRKHYELGGSGWDICSGEAPNILFHESEAWSVEDGEVARYVLAGNCLLEKEESQIPCTCRVESDDKFGSLIYTCPEHDNSKAAQQAKQ